MSETNPQNQNRNKRKRKKTFLQNARKYAKKGYYGRGTKLDEETYQYFVRIMEAYKEGFPSEEDKRNFVNNVFEQTNNEEIKCSCNQVGCRVIETLLPFTNDDVMFRYIKAFGDDLRPLCADRFASHVIEGLLKESSKRSLEGGEKAEQYKDFTLKIGRFLLNNLEDYMWDTYGNHIGRAVLCNLAQISKLDEKTKNDVNIENNENNIPDYYVEIINDYAERLIVWPQFNEFHLSELTSGFLQVLLRTLSKVNPKLLKKYIKKLIDESFSNKEEEDDKLAPVFMSKASMMLLETVLPLASCKLFSQIYAKCFSGKILKLATMRSTNFAVQKLFGSANEKVEFEAMFVEIEEHFNEIFEAGHSGVILALGQACKRLSCKQGIFIQSLMKAFNCNQSEAQQNSFVLCLSKFVTHEKLEESSTLEKDKLNLHGTLIVQLMLDFNKPIKIVNGILNMDPQMLKGLFSNSMGSHIIDSYMKSEYVGEKSREKLVRRMQGTYQDLAISKYGSRSFEALFAAANPKMKQGIMDELCYKDAAWSNSEYGRIIASKVNLLTYKQNKEEWKNSLNKKKKKKETVEDILGT